MGVDLDDHVAVNSFSYLCSHSTLPAIPPVNGYDAKKNSSTPIYCSEYSVPYSELRTRVFSNPQFITALLDPEKQRSIFLFNDSTNSHHGSEDLPIYTVAISPKDIPRRCYSHAESAATYRLRPPPGGEVEVQHTRL
jgi:hypothetical protein